MKSTTISAWKIFCSIRSSKLSKTTPTNMPCERLEILEAGMRLSICIKIEVDLSLRLIVMNQLCGNEFLKQMVHKAQKSTESVKSIDSQNSGVHV